MSGFMKSMGNAMSNISKDISREIGHVTHDLRREVDGIAVSPVLDVFKTGNVVQLVSQSSGNCLEIVCSPTGALVVDGMGQQGPTVYHAHWTVVNEGQNKVRLHNQEHYYVAVFQGAVVLVHCTPPMKPGLETLFRLSVSGNNVKLHSVADVGRQLIILKNGQLNQIAVQDSDSNFTPILIASLPSSQFQQQNPPTTMYNKPK